MLIILHHPEKLCLKTATNFKDNFHNNFQIGNKEILNEANAIQSAGYESMIFTLLPAGVTTTYHILNR